MIAHKKIVAAATIPVIVLIVMAYNDPRFQEHCRYCECENNRSGILRSSSMFRPRGALARAVYTKQVVDSQLARMDHSKWYQVDLSQLSSEMKRIFLPLSLDEETSQFLDNCLEKSDSLLIQIWHSIVKSLLRWFLTQTDINGLLGRGSMFVFSKPHIRQLLGRTLAEEGELLDMGAGDGLITQNLATFFSKVYVTEVSRPMRWTLSKRGFRDKLRQIGKGWADVSEAIQLSIFWADSDQLIAMPLPNLTRFIPENQVNGSYDNRRSLPHRIVLELDEWGDRKYDVVSCLNLLDRCDRPYQILSQVRQSLKPNGVAVFALVLPFHPYVESNRRGNQPSEVLPIQGVTLEQQAASVISNVLEPAGFTVVRWSRLPYLCEGDLRQAYYWLDDVVFVARLAS